MSSGCVPSLDLRKTLALNLCTVDTRIFALLTLFQKPLFRKFEKDIFLANSEQFLPPNLRKHCENNLKLSEILVLVELQRVCKNH